MSTLSCHIPLPSSYSSIQPELPSTPKQFVFARIRGKVYLVQLECTGRVPGSTSSALCLVDATIFTHEFINIFRFSHHTSIHPSEIQVLDSIHEQSTRYEEENGTVFLSKDLMERLRKLTMDSRPIPGRSIARKSRPLRY